MGNGKRGVALLEVLVSVSILTFGLGVTMQAIRTATRTQSRLDVRATGRQLATQQIASLRQMGKSGLQEHMTGAFEEPFSDFSWKAEVHPPVEDSPFAFVEMKVLKTKGDSKQVIVCVYTLI